MNGPPPLPSARKKSDWVAIVTTLAYPGTGQFLQGRRAAGIFLTGITTIVALWWLEEMFRADIAVFRDTGKPDPMLVVRSIIQPTKILGLCYLVSFLDAIIAHWRLNRRVTQNLSNKTLSVTNQNDRFGNK